MTPQVFPSGSKPYGKTYNQWAEEWIKWSLSQPTDTNPIADDSGRNCANMQMHPIWFLAGTFGTSVKRKCTVPYDRGIFFPIIEKECSFAEDGEQLKSESELIARAAGLMDLVTHMKVVVDRHRLPDLRNYRARSRVFDLVFPVNNVYGVKPGLTRSITDGYWLLLKPLSMGIHVIHFTAKASIPNGPIADLAERYIKVKGNSFRTEVIYQLTVK